MFEKQRDGEQTDEKVTERKIRQRVRHRDKWTAAVIDGPLVYSWTHLELAACAESCGL